MRKYNYSMGFAANGRPLPDPAGFSVEVADLDASGERDITGNLHREKVAQKVSLEMQYRNIDWNMAREILSAVNPEQYSFTYQDPRTGGMQSGSFYTGNRKCNAVWMPAGRSPAGWYADVTFSVIEY